MRTITLIKQGNRRTGPGRAKGNGGTDHPTPYNYDFVLTHNFFGCYVTCARLFSIHATLLTFPLF